MAAARAAGDARAYVPLAGAIPPALYLVWLAANPSANTVIRLPAEHAMVVTLVSLMALTVALLVARVALRMAQVQVLLVALGFTAMGGFFAVHAVATPGYIVHDPFAGGGHAGYSDVEGIGQDYTGTVIAASAFMSLFSASFLFAAGSLSAAYLSRVQGRMPIRPRALVLVVMGVLVLYALLAIARGDVVARLPISRPPTILVLAACSMALLAFSAWRQVLAYRATWLPIHGALALAFVLLAQAQVLMVITVIWSLAWWMYHVLMLAGVILSLGALFLELDRRRGLERYLPGEVVERVVAGDALRLAGERRVVTVMFADLRGSTTAAERMSAEEVVSFLNAYVGAMARCVFAESGMLDKFLGDGIMAIFGVVRDPTDGAEPALRAARAMRAAIAEVNHQRAASGGSVVGFGVGLHTGEVVLGSIGLPQRSDFTAVGDTVNTAARLEGECKAYGVDVVLSAETASRLRGGQFDLQDLGEVTVRGRSEPIRVLTLGPESARATVPGAPRAAPAIV